MKKLRVSEFTPKPSRVFDWMEQAKRDIGLAEIALKNNYFEWVCYLSEQGVEKALKAVGHFLARTDRELQGHSTADLLKTLPPQVVTEDLRNACMFIDQHVRRSRYPDTLKTGYPGRQYDKETANEVFKDARNIISFTEKLINHLDKSLTQFSRKLSYSTYPHSED